MRLFAALCAFALAHAALAQTSPAFVPAPLPGAHPSPAFVPAPVAPPAIRETPAPRTASSDRIAVLLASRASRGARATRAPILGMPAPASSDVGQPLQPAGVEALIASLATRLPLQLVEQPVLEDPGRRALLERALVVLAARLAERPRSAELHSLRATIHLELKDPAGALAGYSRAAALEPHRAAHRHNRGIVHARLSHFDAARSDLAAAHRLEPALFGPAPAVLAGLPTRSWLGRPGRHLRPPPVDLR